MMLGAAFVAALSALGVASSAPRIETTPAAVHAGQIVRVHGLAGACPRGDTLTLISSAFVHTHDFAGKPAISAAVSSTGGFSVRTRIPLRRRPGRYAITGRCGGGNLGVIRYLQIEVPSGGDDPPATLPIDR